MGCNCLSIAQLNASSDFIKCVRASLGVSPETTWDAEAHAALYNMLATQVDILSERRQTSDEIRAVAWMAEPAKTAEYVARFGDWKSSDDTLWSCLGITKAEADLSMHNGSGAYWSMISAAATTVGLTESGGSSKDDGLPMWGWALFALAAGVTLWAVMGD